MPAKGATRVDSIRVESIKLILASGSPRRKALLEAAGIDFAVAESGLDEVREAGEDATAFALRMAREKAISVAERFPAAIVLAADTIVECEGQILGKPSGAAEARAMLRTLAGKTHTVVTAFAVAHAGTMMESMAVTSRVRFRPLSEEEIAAYVASGAPLDKAGAYGIQDAGGGFIEEVEGGRDNVMGLPVREVVAALRRQGIAVDGGRR